MAILSMQRHLTEDNRNLALGVGAGKEHTSFFLTNFFRWVFATDLYASSGWDYASPPEMLIEPEKVGPRWDYNPRRLVVQHMDGTNLRFEDNTFDFIFSCSSIEHFGRPDDIIRAAREMGRVLKPGGIIAISTEYLLTGPFRFLLLDADNSPAGAKRHYKAHCRAHWVYSRGTHGVLRFKGNNERLLAL